MILCCIVRRYPLLTTTCQDHASFQLWSHACSEKSNPIYSPLAACAFASSWMPPWQRESWYGRYHCLSMSLFIVDSECSSNWFKPREIIGCWTLISILSDQLQSCAPLLNLRSVLDPLLVRSGWLLGLSLKANYNIIQPIRTFNNCFTFNYEPIYKIGFL